jgi:hypothetical protein
LSVVLKEDMGRGFTVFARFLREKAIRHYWGTAMALSLAGLIAVLIFPPEAQHKDEAKEVSVEPDSEPVVFPFAFESSIPTLSFASSGFVRPVYPYSIIPGGIRSVKELKDAIARDPLVKSHYRGFNLAKARIVSVTKDRVVHVSYRRGGGIYWTAKKVMLRKGETLITDGRNASRTRCGNRISDGPAIPSSPEEPPPAVFDEPVVPPAAVPLPPPYASAPPPPPGGLIPIVPIIPIFPGSGSNPPPPVHPKPPGPPPISVPEPSTLYLLMVSLPVVWLALKKRSG